MERFGQVPKGLQETMGIKPQPVLSTEVRPLVDLPTTKAERALDNWNHFTGIKNGRYYINGQLRGQRK